LDEWSLVCSNENDCCCFLYLERFSRFDVAAEICEALKGSFPSFHSEDKNKFIYVFQDDLRHKSWVGQGRKNSTFEYVDGIEYDFTSWNDGSPSYGVNASDCVHFVGHEDEGFTLQFK